MTKEKIREEFIELAKTFEACAYGQKNFSEETFQKCFGFSKDEGLQNSISEISHKLFELSDGKVR